MFSRSTSNCPGAHSVQTECASTKASECLHHSTSRFLLLGCICQIVYIRALLLFLLGVGGFLRVVNENLGEHLPGRLFDTIVLLLVRVRPPDEEGPAYEG